MCKRTLPLLLSLLFTCTSFFCFADNQPIAPKKRLLEKALACHTGADKPGIVVRLDHKGEKIYSDAFGIKNRDTNEPLNVNDQFQIGSLTKHFTAAAILKLSEQGKLSLDDTLGKFIPSVKKRQKHITISQLLSHTSGLDDYFDSRKITRNWHKPASSEEVIKAVSRTSSSSEPGEVHRYSNVGYLYLGRIIEIVSGKSYAGYLKDELFVPLKLDNTYVKEQGAGLETVVGYSNDDSLDVVDRSWMYAAGAIVSTLDDLSRWHKALAGGNVISLKSYQLMITKAKLNNGEAVNYGMGLDIYPIANLPSYSHQGQVPGYYAFFAYFPEHDLFAAALTNNDRAHPGPTLLNMIAIQLGLSPKMLPPAATNQMDMLLGKYQFDDGYTLEIFNDGGNYFAKSREFDRRALIPREDMAFSFECTEDYYQLRAIGGVDQLVPVGVYYGEGKAGIKL